MKKIILSMLLCLAGMSAAAQSVTFKAPVDWDYDDMRHVRVEDNQYQIGVQRQRRFVPTETVSPQPLDYGGEFSFDVRLVDHGDRAIVSPQHGDLHQREAYLYRRDGKVLMAQNIIREEAATRIDTTHLMNFKVRRLMTQGGLPENYDGPFEVEVNITPDDTTALSAFEMVNGGGDTLAVRIDHKAGTLTLWQGRALASLPLATAVGEEQPQEWHLNIFVSRRTAEVFVNDGRGVLSHSVQLLAPLSTVLLKSEGGKTKFANIGIYSKPKSPLRLVR
ncbi:MAG: hypothetical protein KA067_01760 [Prevotella sp.]|nr:hypothetical protein [Prevotella sp.]